jgi:hypothetical protein
MASVFPSRTRIFDSRWSAKVWRSSSFSWNDSGPGSISRSVISRIFPSLSAIAAITLGELFPEAIADTKLAISDSIFRFSSRMAMN